MLYFYACIFNFLCMYMDSCLQYRIYYYFAIIKWAWMILNSTSNRYSKNITNITNIIGKAITYTIVNHENTLQ